MTVASGLSCGYMHFSPWACLPIALLAGCTSSKRPATTTTGEPGSAWVVDPVAEDPASSAPYASDPAPSDSYASDPAPAAGTATSPQVIDPDFVCPDSETKHFTLDLALPDGCGPIPTVVDAQDIYLTHLGSYYLSIEVAGSPAKTSRLESIDLDVRALGFVSEGCGASIRYVGPIGTLELAFAASGYNFADDNIAGTGRWTPARGTACAFELTGSYYSD